MRRIKHAAASLCFLLALAAGGRVARSDPPDANPPPPRHETLQPELGDGWQQVPQHRLVLGAIVGGRLDPIGAELQVRTGYQLRLNDRESPLHRDNFLFLGAFPRVNPASTKLGPSIELQPLSIFNLRLAAEYVRYFGTFGSLQSFPSPLADDSDMRLGDGQDAALNYATDGAHLVIEPTLQFKAGPLAVRNRLSFEYWYVNLRGDDRVFYEATHDTLLSSRGWLITDDLDVLVFANRDAIIGGRYSVVKPLYSAGDFRLGESRYPENNSLQRLGPVLSYTFFSRGPTAPFNKPTLLFLCQWYIDHRYRTGTAPAAIIPWHYVNSTGLPYLILAFSFQSDLLPRRR